MAGLSRVPATAVEGTSGRGRERVDDRLDLIEAIAPARAALNEALWADQQIDAAPHCVGFTASSSAVLAALKMGFDRRASMIRITKSGQRTPPAINPSPSLAGEPRRARGRDGYLGAGMTLVAPDLAGKAKGGSARRRILPV